MTSHDFHRPIPPGTVRVSVIHSGECFTLDLPSDRIATTVQAFEDHCEDPMSADQCMAVAVEAADDGDAHMVTAAALWLFLLQPGGEGEMNSIRLAEMISTNGSALLTAMACEKTGEWTHRLYAMPRWPAGVAPHRPTSRDLRRRWR
jgi:hypothetical protein